jgi:AraC-like DNA-binding protein
MSRAIEDRNRRMLRARDTMDRAFAQPLDVRGLARVAHVSPAHFSRQFRTTFGETPHRYLQRRLSRVFREVVGESPSSYRARFEGEGAALLVPACWAMAWLRPAG